MDAKLVRKNLLNHIEVTFPNGDVHNLWEGIIAHCSDDLSTNELKDTYAQISEQLNKMSPDDIPLIFKKMMSELQAVIVNRKAY
jgi:hypothetical protein